MSGEIVLAGRLICAGSAEADAVRQHLPLHTALTLAEPGCLAFAVIPTDDPLVWHVTERFSDRAAFDAHQARAGSSAWAEATRGIRRDYTISEEDAPSPGQTGRK